MEKVTRKKSILAMCHQCMGHWSDGKVDCDCVKCPLYHWQPYRKKEPDYKWLEYNPTRKGLVTWEETARELSEDAKKELVARLKGQRS